MTLEISVSVKNRLPSSTLVVAVFLIIWKVHYSVGDQLYHTISILPITRSPPELLFQQTISFIMLQVTGWSSWVPGRDPGRGTLSRERCVRLGTYCTCRFGLRHKHGYIVVL